MGGAVLLIFTGRWHRRQSLWQQEEVRTQVLQVVGEALRLQLPLLGGRALEDGVGERGRFTARLFDGGGGEGREEPQRLALHAFQLAVSSSSSFGHGRRWRRRRAPLQLAFGGRFVSG
jgi:hypothetical protein